MLSKTHLRVWRHFKRAHLDKPESPGAALRREEFINRELGAMRIAAGINEQIAEQPVRQPRRGVAKAADVAIEFLESDFEFVERVVARLVNAWRLRSWTDEQTAK
jgi:hypothetical protein